MPKKHQGKCVVFDVGKTFAKVSVVDSDGRIWIERRRATPHVDTPLYRAFDVDALHDWLMEQLRDLGSHYAIDRIIPVTHGATCAFLDEDHRLVQPVQDYESAVPGEYVRAYGRIRPGFDETQSPSLPLGLNLGCQIFWHSRRAPTLFARVRWILNYPQYWVWRLTGALCNEVTSMGCHTDLWCPERKDFSSLAVKQGWAELFPPMHPAWEPVATLRGDLAQAAGLPPSVKVCVGAHDTNAALASVIVDSDDSPALLSTGTWYIAMAPGASPEDLVPQRDCLANVDVYGRPVPCARFMGGRVYDSIVGNGTTVDEAALRAVMRKGTAALPVFLDTPGVCPGLNGEVPVSGETAREKAAIGLLYVALMTSACLDLVRASDQVLIEGPAAGNPLLCGLIAALRPGQVVVEDNRNAVTLGAARLAFYDSPAPRARIRQVVAPVLRDDIRRYRELWRGRVSAELAA
ncbi:hypothetical protein ABAC460_00740 [Asticcacaulis sp. AC460]|uniref:FGGY-family carbohydrate kinase n=1 Tax=Asticcacaulis sp. AC460 TaxID=1282360 RepID=UPI0003C3F977|nr:FGGY family carbohydrate kinase [Asticcacaulis sp. AC460]ESQ93259.1 hypothetical protein ABAC460_00740 [Asticcacaulis sp. AC460]